MPVKGKSVESLSLEERISRVRAKAEEACEPIERAYELLQQIRKYEPAAMRSQLDEVKRQTNIAVGLLSELCALMTEAREHKRVDDGATQQINKAHIQILRLNAIEDVLEKMFEQLEETVMQSSQKLDEIGPSGEYADARSAFTEQLSRSLKATEIFQMLRPWYEGPPPDVNAIQMLESMRKGLKSDYFENAANRWVTEHGAKEQARVEAEEAQRQRKAEERTRIEAEERAQREAEERAQREAEAEEQRQHEDHEAIERMRTQLKAEEEEEAAQAQEEEARREAEELDLSQLEDEEVTAAREGRTLPRDSSYSYYSYSEEEEETAPAQEEEEDKIEEFSDDDSDVETLPTKRRIR